MINEKSQRELALEKGSCPEACFYCPGIGLDNSLIDHLGAEWFQSCHNWPRFSQAQLERMSQGKRRWFLPSKWLQGRLWRRLLQRIPPESELVLLLGESGLNDEAFLALKDRYPLEIWVIPHRKFNALKALKALPESLHNLVYFYCPLYETYPDRFLKAQELARLFRSIKKALPGFVVRAPSGMEVFNPTLHPEDLRKTADVLFNSSKAETVDVSVIIPSYNNKDYVSRVIKGLARQEASGLTYEVVLVDDGSADGTSDHLLQQAGQNETPENFVLLYFPRAKERRMGDFQFRAGRAREVGIKHAKGEVLAFLDSDILVPPNYIRHLHEAHKEHGHDVVQIQRWYLRKEASESLQSYGTVNRTKDVFHPEGGYWKIFFEDPEPWQEIPNYWKYVCTYGLSVKASLYEKVGGFKKAFNSYGFEDTEFGYRLAKSGARFFKSPLVGYHLWHEPNRSEFGNSFWRRYKLLGRSANIFFRGHLDLEIYDELRTLLKEH